MKLFGAMLALAIVASVRAQDSDACPEPDGFFADAEQCDRYYECTDNVLTEKLCPDGQVFADLGIERCDYPFNVDCTGREKLQPAVRSVNCPRANGYFAHPNNSVCDQFFFCSDGQFNPITCPTGLVFNPKTGTCSWPGEARRPGCLSTDVNDFECPSEGDESQGSNPLYPDEDDCQFFYICINNRDPRRTGCTTGLVFNRETKRCDKPKNVSDEICRNWYKQDEDEESEEEESEEVVAPPPRKKSRN